ASLPLGGGVPRRCLREYHGIVKELRGWQNRFSKDDQDTACANAKAVSEPAASQGISRHRRSSDAPRHSRQDQSRPDAQDAYTSASDSASPTINLVAWR